MKALKRNLDHLRGVYDAYTKLLGRPEAVEELLQSYQSQYCTRDHQSNLFGRALQILALYGIYARLSKYHFHS